MLPKLIDGPIAGLGRFSTEHQRKTSIEDQKAVVDGALAAARRKLDYWFFDEAESAASLDRPGYRDLMGAVAGRKVRVIIVDDVERVSRDLADGMTFWKLVNFHEVQFISIADGIDSMRPGDEMKFMLKLMTGQMSRTSTTHTTTRTMHNRATKGLATGNKTYGYANAEGEDGEVRLVVVDVEAKWVVFMFEKKAEGYPVRWIARELTKHGVPVPRARMKHASKPKAWSEGTVRSILANPIYDGRGVYNKTRWVRVPGTDKRVQRDNPPSEHIHFVAPRIVDADLWRTAQEKLAEVAKTFTKKADGSPKGRALSGRVDRHALSGLLFCAACGGPMTVSKSSSADYYQCKEYKRGGCHVHKALRESLALRCITQALRAKLGRGAGLAYARKRIVEEIASVARGRNAGLRTAQERLAKVEADLAGVMGFIKKGIHSDAVVEELRILEEQRKRDQRAVAELGRAASVPVRIPSDKEVLDLVFRIEDRVRQDPMGAKALFLELFQGGRIELHLGADGVFTARSKLLPLVLFAEAKQKTAEPLSRDSAVFGGSSGGAIHALKTAILLDWEARCEAAA